MFSLGRNRPHHEPSAAERAGVTHPQAVARAVASLDLTLARWSGVPDKDWAWLDRVLDERLAVRPPRPSPRPSVPFIPGGLG